MTRILLGAFLVGGVLLLVPLVGGLSLMESATAVFTLLAVLTVGVVGIHLIVTGVAR